MHNFFFFFHLLYHSSLYSGFNRSAESQSVSHIWTHLELYSILQTAQALTACVGMEHEQILSSQATNARLDLGLGLDSATLQNIHLVFEPFLSSFRRLLQIIVLLGK